MSLIVLKFGSSVLRTEADLPSVVHEILRWRLLRFRVVAVVSALAGRTDALVARSARWGASSPDLIGLGEAESAALLGLALRAVGVDARVHDASFLRTTSGCEADPIALVDPLDHDVEVLPGFVGRDRHGRATLLGRGGSDLTALFVAHTLRGRCRLLKDVDAIYDADPARVPGARPYERVHWDDVDGCIVQARAVRWARDRHLCFDVGSTEVGPVSILRARREGAAAL